MNNGSLWANGLNDKGQLGIGTTGSAIGPNSTSYITSLTQMSKTYKGKPIAISCGVFIYLGFYTLKHSIQNIFIICIAIIIHQHL
jgi:hypothetical protein